jgi:LuxR family maltose regulon positive regulatory protein
LLSELDAAAPLTVLRGPLGFGKTTLLAQWLHADRFDGAVGWVRAATEADTASLWERVHDTLEQAGIIRPTRTNSTPMLARLRRAIAGSAEPVLLVIDQFERITDDDIETDLLELLRDTPQLRLIVCTRSSRYFRPHRVADLDATLVDPRDLLLTVEEITELLRSVGLAADRRRAAELHADAGGWPEMTRAIALALARPASRRRRDTADTAGTTDTAEAVSAATDYLRDRLLPEVRDRQRLDFALASAVPAEVTPELAEIISPGFPGATELRRLEASGLLFVSMSSGGDTYRWPAAVRRVLLAELNERSPDLARTVRIRVARWCQQQHQPGGALRHALDAQDQALIIEVVEAGWRTLMERHRDLLFQAVMAVPRDVISGSTRSLAVRDLVLHQPDDDVLNVVLQPATDSEDVADLARSSSVADVLDTGTALLHVLDRRGRYDLALSQAGVLEDVASAARGADNDEVAEQVAGTATSVGVIRLLADDLEGGARALEHAYNYASDIPNARLSGDAAGILALALALRGEVERARSWLDRRGAATSASAINRLSGPGSAFAQTALTLVALELLDTSAAGAALADLDDDAPFQQNWAFAAYARAQHALYVGDPVGGLRILDEVRARHATRAGVGSTAGPLLAATEAELLLACGRGNEANGVLNGTHSHHPMLQVGHARLALLGGQPAAALRRTRDVTSSRTGGRRTQLDMLLIRGIAHHRLEQPRSAADAIGFAIRAARASASLRPFAAVSRAELEAIAEHLDPADADFLSNPALRAVVPVFPRNVGLVRLTGRERLLLTRMAAGESKSQIAEHLFISVNTAKSHLRSLYRKLDANTRDQAIARAGALGLLQPDARSGELSVLIQTNGR